MESTDELVPITRNINIGSVSEKDCKCCAAPFGRKREKTNIPKIMSTIPNFDNFRNEMSKRNAIIEAQTKLLAMLEMAAEVKIQMAKHLYPSDFKRLCDTLDDCWKQEQMNLETIEQINK